MTPSSSTPTTQEPPVPPLSVVDGVTGDDDGGREEGDVELALFRRIRSLSNVSIRLTNASRTLRSPGVGYRRYFNHPLSMFSAESQPDSEHHTEHHALTPPDHLPSASDEDGATTAPGTPPPQSPAVTTHLTPPVDTTPRQPSPISRPSSSLSPQLSSTPVPALDESQSVSSANSEQDASSDASVNDHRRVRSSGVAWRDALVQACATLLCKSIEDLDTEFQAIVAATTAPATAFPTEATGFEPIPRDLADHAIITTLKTQDAQSMQNATSWLFNMMDRTGAGFVLRDEFVRYAPFIGPVADSAVAGIVFEELVLHQVRKAADAEDSLPQERRKKTRSPVVNNRRGENVHRPHSPGLRLRRLSPRNSREASASPTRSLSRDSERRTSHSADAPSRDLFPPSAALRFETWRRFFLAVQDKYNYKDDDWIRVKKELGIDPDEVLIKSQGAMDHSDLFPTLGKLYLSQRYLIFFAAVGRNHYVTRLGSVAKVENFSIPLMMRDCIRVHLDSETKAARDGISPLMNEEGVVAADGSRASDQHDGRQELTQSQHVGKLMRQFMAGRKPLTFSLLEFREMKRRDNWLQLIREMVAAHRLHVELGFGSAGRAMPSLQKSNSNAPEVGMNSDPAINGTESNSETHLLQTLNYAKSPFRNEPSPPLLAVAAHANIVRYRALRRVTEKLVSAALLVFSHAERNTALVNWYTDSVRAYDHRQGRTWIERALSAVRENMDRNNRIYRVQDDEPFDVGKLGDAIGRLAELCAPLVRVIVFFQHLFQWRNPPATILAILVCILIAANRVVHVVPAGLVFMQAAWVVETKFNWLGLGMGGSASEDAERRQANVLELVAQVHDTLAAAQNVLFRLNRELGKVQTLFLWASPDDRDSWVAVAVLCAVGLVLLIVPSQTLFLFLVFFSFFKHFLPPNNPGLRFWQSLPSRIETSKKKQNRNQRRTSNNSIPSRTEAGRVES